MAKGDEGKRFMNTDYSAIELRIMAQIAEQGLGTAAKRISELEEQLSRSATVCPKEHCMLWKGHKEDHATAEEVSRALELLRREERKQ